MTGQRGREKQDDTPSTNCDIQKIPPVENQVCKKAPFLGDVCTYIPTNIIIYSKV